MSARVVSGLAPAGKPHPTTKWSLLMALLVVVWLGIPKFASAGAPTVQPPTGPGSGYSGGTYYFSSAYSFATYITCTSGLNFNSSYSNGMMGTHQFDFYGAPDGSLLVSIDGGGLLLITSCGDPYATPATDVANYSVAIASPPPPTPSPSPPPTPTPTPPPPTPTPHNTGGGGGGHTSGGNTGGSNTGAGSSSSGANSNPSDSSTGTGPSAIVNPTIAPSPLISPVVSLKPAPKHHMVLNVITSAPRMMVSWLLPLSLLFLFVLLLWLLYLRFKRLRAWVSQRTTWLKYRVEPYWFRLKTAVRRLLRGRGHELLKHRGLSEHRHSGKLMAHHHTSYASLAFLLLISSIFVTTQTVATLADATASSTLSLTVLGPPPTSPAVIDEPTPGEHFSSPTQSVLGTCPGDVFVEIWRNGVFAGSSICDSSDLFSVLITLVPGSNDLVARVVDALGQYGPDSAHVLVFYDQPQPSPSPTSTPTPSPVPSVSPAPLASKPPAPPASSGNTGVSVQPPPVIITSAKHFYQGFSPDESVGWQINVSGGVPPYEVTWEWGDGTNSTDFLGNHGDITMTHQYPKAGDYNVIIRAKDKDGTEGVLQVVVVVNGAAISGAALNSDTPGNLIFIWPLLILSALIVLSFWLGERHEWAILKPRFGRPILHPNS